MSGRTRRPKLVPKVVFGLTLGASVVPAISCTPRPMPGVADMSYTRAATEPDPTDASSQDGTTTAIAFDAAPAVIVDAAPPIAPDAGRVDAGKADAGKVDAGKVDAGRVSPVLRGPPVLVVAQIGYENPVALKAYDGPGTKTP